MRVLSLFDGISMGKVALERGGVCITTYYKAEIDPYALLISKKNHPTTINLGDVTQWREWDIDFSKIDLLIGGSPCQGFSVSGNLGGTKAVLDGEEILILTKEQYIEVKEKKGEFLSQSHLFWEYLLCLEHIKALNPKVFFLLENVKMQKENMVMISRALGVEPVLIDSALLTAQRRKRYYWCNWEIKQPKDLGVTLRDIVIATDEGIIRDEILGRYTQPNGLPKGYCDYGSKSRCLTASMHKGYGNDGCTVVMHPTGKFRKLHPLECERLQGLPDNYTEGVSNTQRYKTIGNGWTVPVLEHIFRAMPGG